jgi:hypothetical protein
VDREKGLTAADSSYSDFLEIDLTAVQPFVMKQSKLLNHSTKFSTLERISEAINGFAEAFQEYRFQTSLAHYYFYAGESEMTALRKNQVRLPLPEPVKTLIGHYRTPITVRHLVDSPTSIQGNRLPAVWFSGQLINSAMSLNISATDKLFAAICFSYSYKSSSKKYPKFTENGVNGLSTFLGESLDIQSLKHIQQTKTNNKIRSWRNDNLHSKNRKTEHNGEFATHLENSFQIVNTIPMEDYLSLPSEFHNNVTIPLYECLIHRLTSTNEPG